MKEWEEELKIIFCKCLGISENELEAVENKHLFGKAIGLPVREAIILFVDIEKSLGIKLPEDKVLKGEFSTYCKIKQMVKGEFERNAASEYKG